MAMGTCCGPKNCVNASALSLQTSKKSSDTAPMKFQCPTESFACAARNDVAGLCASRVLLGGREGFVHEHQNPSISQSTGRCLRSDTSFPVFAVRAPSRVPVTEWEQQEWCCVNRRNLRPPVIRWVWRSSVQRCSLACLAWEGGGKKRREDGWWVARMAFSTPYSRTQPPKQLFNGPRALSPLTDPTPTVPSLTSPETVLVQVGVDGSPACHQCPKHAKPRNLRSELHNAAQQDTLHFLV